MTFEISLGACRALATSAFLLLASTGAFAQSADATSLGKFEGWEALTYSTPESKVCYVFGAPAKSDSTKKVKRSDVYFMVGHWPGKKVKSQPSTMAGYTMKPGSDVTLSIGGKTFLFYPVGEQAWTDKPDTEKAIVAAMKSGKTMTVKAVSARSGTETTDTYALAGFKAAMEVIDGACK